MLLGHLRVGVPRNPKVACDFRGVVDGRMKQSSYQNTGIIQPSGYAHSTAPRRSVRTECQNFSRVSPKPKVRNRICLFVFTGFMILHVLALQVHDQSVACTQAIGLEQSRRLREFRAPTQRPKAWTRCQGFWTSDLTPKVKQLPICQKSIVIAKDSFGSPCAVV